jgi:hypothetical protein
MTSPAAKPGGLPQIGTHLHHEYAAALLAVDDARQAMHAAQVSGNVNAKLDADLEYLRATEALASLKHREASDLLLRMRFAREMYPGRLEELVDPHHREELDITQQAVADLEHRASAVEEAVATLEAQGGAQ